MRHGLLQRRSGQPTRTRSNHDRRLVESHARTMPTVSYVRYAVRKGGRCRRTLAMWHLRSELDRSKAGHSSGLRGLGGQSE